MEIRFIYKEVRISSKKFEKSSLQETIARKLTPTLKTAKSMSKIGPVHHNNNARPRISQMTLQN